MNQDQEHMSMKEDKTSILGSNHPLKPKWREILTFQKIKIQVQVPT